jgi:hypothetical protein
MTRSEPIFMSRQAISLTGQSVEEPTMDDGSRPYQGKTLVGR